MALYSYKTQVSSHGSRLQNIEEQFMKGMQFTNTPLMEGFVKTLVNFDLYDGGLSLKPRPGLRTTKAYSQIDADTAVTGDQIFASKEQYAGTQPLTQFFIGSQVGDVVSNKLHLGKVRCLTEGPEAPFAHTYDGVPLNKYHEITQDSLYFTKPTNAEIHGVPVINQLGIAKQIGTFAWNGNYYTFDSTSNNILHTEIDPTTKLCTFVSDAPKALTSKEAVMWGYNASSATPYTFANVAAGAGSPIIFTGMLPYTPDGALCLAPVINQSLEFEAFFSVVVGAKYHFVWEWKSTTGDTWNKILESDTLFTVALEKQQVSFSPPDDSIILRVSAYGFTGETQNTDTEAVLAVGFSFKKEEYGSTANISVKTYTLKQSTGMTYWKNRLVVWGAPEDPQMLFTSDVNDPTYFPYPNGCDIFEEPIKYAVPFLDYLLVFTSSKLYLLTLSPDGMGWTTDCIQNNLTIADWDIHLIQIVKNMVFFRSGSYYYMVVPKSGGMTGELTLATISKPQYYFFDNFMDNVKEVVESTTSYAGSLELVHYYNYLDFEDVHNVYVFATDKGEYINFCMLYNTINRSWRVYTIGSQSVLTPFKADATQRGTLCSLASEIKTEVTYLLPQLLRFSNTNNADVYLPHGIDFASLVPPLSDLTTTFSAVHIFKNWQFLDTGYREHMSNFKKRYREMQFIINNISNQALQFFTDFLIDGELRQKHYTREVVQELDPLSPNYGVITIEKVLTAPIIAPATTALGADNEDVSQGWVLGVSMFPEVSFWKARIPVSGKGYTPRFFLNSRNEVAYELLNISWVYRQLYSR